MRIGSVSHSSHAAGMSALWHDPEFDAPVKRFETPLVQKTFDDLPVPTEHHELPDGVTDPFHKLDAVYDAAAVQMERGIKGAEFLHGKKPAVDAKSDPTLVRHDDVTRLQDRPVALDPAKQAVQKLDKQEREQIRRTEQASVTQPTTNTGGSKTAADKEAEKVANQGNASAADSALNVAMTFGPMAVAQGATTLAQGPLPVLATQAIQTAGAVASVVELGVVGVTEGLKESPPAGTAGTEGSSSSTPRRGLSNKR